MFGKTTMTPVLRLKPNTHPQACSTVTSSRTTGDRPMDRVPEFGSAFCDRVRQSAIGCNLLARPQEPYLVLHRLR